MKRLLVLAGGFAFTAASSGCGNTVGDPDVGAAATEDSALTAESLCDKGLKLQCEQLAALLQYPNTVFTAATPVAANALVQTGQSIGAHCLLVGKMNERVSEVDGQTYAIGFEMRLPLAWNGRFFYQANGGFDGNVLPAVGNTSGGGPLTSALAQGFAVLSSDAGHSAAQNPVFGLDPRARLDYGYQAVGHLTPMAKSVLRAAYGQRPAFSYIGGCSNGGRHAMVAAARYPDAFDGYLVGAPGFHLPQAAIASIYGGQQYAAIAEPGATIPVGPFAGLPDLTSGFTTPERQLLVSKVLERCDELDGLADGIVGATSACQAAFDLDRDVPTCAGERNGSCLTIAQKAAIGNAFAGPKTSAGQAIYRAFPFDSGLAANGTGFWDFISPLIMDSMAVGFVFGTPPVNPATFIPPLFALTANVDLLAASIAATNATYTESALSFMNPPNETDMVGLKRHGGRMIVYHGVSDPIFSSSDTAEWFSNLEPSAKRNARLYLVPGMNHCSDGPSTDQFDLLTALVRWVEHGRPPTRLAASARGVENPGGPNLELPAGWAPNRTRPLCPYPQVAVYRGGDAERAESFGCR